jgi:alkylated DNA repair dioxygenase AlkB
MQQGLFDDSGELPLCAAQVSLYRQWLDLATAETLFSQLRDALVWQQPEIYVAGRTHKIPRLQSWYGDPEAIYTYSRQTFVPLPWTTALMELRLRMEAFCNTSFNSVLANFYRSGTDGMGFHADDELELGSRPIIASLSLGATRKFVFKSKDPMAQQRYDVNLHAGDLLVMAGDTQRHWHHGLPKTRLAVGGRINLTFRCVQPVSPDSY